MTQRYQSRAGYVGAYAIFVFSYGLLYLRSLDIISDITVGYIFVIVPLSFMVMLVFEYFFKKNYNIKYNHKVVYLALSKSKLYLMRSTLWRFFALLFPVLLFYYIIHNHSYFTKGDFFAPTREFADYYLYTFLLLSPPYIFLTLLYRGDKKYEFGDYAILSIIAMKSLVKSLLSRKYSKKFHRNKRVKKVWLLYLVNFVFFDVDGYFYDSRVSWVSK
ncbi:MAG: hypothetical protein Q9M39_05540 [Sulfurovum sp.]|nr:hypothetical protein [Sulfurovum sp.]